MKKQHIERPANEFNQIGSIGQISSMDWAEIPTYYYDQTRFELPLTNEEFNTQFGAQRVVFNLEDDPPCERQTNTAVGSSVNEVFLAMGAGVIAIGEGEAFSHHGITIDRPAAARTTPLTLGMTGTCSDYYCGVVDLRSVATVDGAAQAILWWGAPTWRFIEKFFQAYRLQVLVNRRFEVVNESLLDVGMAPLPPEFVGASESRIPTLPFIRAVNDVMAAKAINSVFMVVNRGTSDTGDFCIAPPHVPVTYGHPRIVGLSNRIYQFSQPIMFMPYMHFEVSFLNIEDETCYRALRSSVTLSCPTQDETLTNEVNGITEACGIQCIVPGGTVSLGVVMKGYALQPQACIDYLTQTLSGTISAEMYRESEYLMGLSGHDLHGHLAGYLEGR